MSSGKSGVAVNGIRNLEYAWERKRQLSHPDGTRSVGLEEIRQTSPTDLPTRVPKKYQENDYQLPKKVNT